MHQSVSSSQADTRKSKLSGGHTDDNDRVKTLKKQDTIKKCYM